MPGVTHGTAMKLRCNRGTLHRLPKPGVQWRWSDVVDVTGDDDGKVSKKDACSAKPLLEKHGDGVWETTPKLAGYLESQWGIEVGDNGGAGQARLPVETDVTSSSRLLSDGSESPVESQGELRQAALDGSDATEDVRAVTVQEDARVIGSYSVDLRPKHETAAQDENQAGLDAFDTTTVDAVTAGVDKFDATVWVGRFTRPTGDVYA